MTAAEMDIIIGAEVQGAVNGLKQVNAQLVKTEQTATKFNQKASKDFTGLSRIIQDLPFGFIAISNNLTQLLPAAGGLGLAFSALVSAVTFLSTGFSNWTRGLGENKEALKENADAVKELEASAGKEIATLTTLTNAAKNTNLSMKERLAAVQKLREEFPSYFQDLNTEKILNGDVAAAIQATSNALFQRAVIRQKESQLGPVAGQLFDLRQQREELVKQQQALQRIVAIASKSRSADRGITSRLVGAGSQDRAALDDVAKKIAAIDAAITPVQGQFKRLSQAIIDASQAAGAGVFSDDVKEKLKKAAKEVSDFFLVDTNIKDIPKKFIGAIAKETGDNINKIVGLDKPVPVSPLIQIKPKYDPTFLAKMAEDQVKIFSDTIQGAFEAVGEGIGNLVTGKGNFFGALLDVLGKGLEQLGKYVIAASALIGAVKEALNAAFTNPITGILAGVALVALGKVLQNAIPKFATGGVVTKPTLALVGEAGPERITPLGYEGRANNVMQGEVVFQISGQSLRGILRRADQTAFNTF